MLRGMELSKSFGEGKVLERVSIDVAPGTITSILGPSGGGKSTLLRILAMLDRPDCGTVELDGTMHHSPWPKVTLVFQQQFLWPHLSLEENVILPIRSMREFDPKSASALFRTLDLEHVKAKRPWQLSQGERARTALVRGILLNPRYLLLDEVTAALDSERSEQVGLILRSLADRGTGIAFVTHDQDFSMKWSDRTLRLERSCLSGVNNQ